MHELGITRNIVEIVSEQAAGAQVSRVKLAVGRLSAVLPDALRFCYSEVIRGTPLAESELEIEEIDGSARCLDCGTEYAMPLGGARCPCGSYRFELLAGDELKIVEMDIL